MCQDHDVEYLTGIDQRPRLPLRRPSRGAQIAGVCAGLAAHMRIEVRQVRILFILLAAAGGLGLVAYAFLWVCVPEGDPHELGRDLDPQARLAKPLIVDEPAAPSIRSRLLERASHMPLRDIALGLILLTVAALLVASRFGWNLEWSWVFSALVVIVGLGLAWGQLDSAQRGSLLGKSGGRTGWGGLRLVGGVGLVVIGVLLLIGQESGGGQMFSSLVAAIAVLAGVALVLAPLWLRLANQLGEERASAALARERSEIAAHLHDSVLQTLALIQRSSEQPGEVTRLARNQERELRSWLYNDRSTPGTSVADHAREVVANVENAMVLASGGDQTVSIELVVVGDATPSDDTEALLAAMAEALKNAVRHGKPPVSAYLEVRDTAFEVFVTDRGDGFELSEIAEDRFGVKESIVGRIERRGGTAKFRKMAVGGTEVALRIPRASAPSPRASDASSGNGTASSASSPATTAHTPHNIQEPEGRDSK